MPPSLILSLILSLLLLTLTQALPSTTNTLMSAYLGYNTTYSEWQAEQNQCKTWIQDFVKNLTSGKLSNLPTIVYSGLTTNNPGQMKQCLQQNYSYFLIHFDNISQPFQTYTSACLPAICNAENLESALSVLNVTVYDYPEPERKMDGLAITGTVVVALWASVLVVWSCVVSFKGDEVKEMTRKKNQGERISINEEELAEPILQPVDEVVPEFKLFVFYDGYQELFKIPSKISIFSPIIFLAVLSYLVSIEFSYRLSISQNEKTTSQDLLNSFWGVLACNTEIALHTIMFILGLRLAYGIYKIDTLKGILRYYFDNVLRKWVLLVLMTLLIYAFIEAFTSDPLHKIWNLNNGIDCPGYMWQIWFLFRNMQVDCRACLPWMSLLSAEIFFTLVATPLVLIFRTSKKLGYGLFTLIIFLSMIASVAILDSHSITYQPYKLTTGQREYALNYQPNTFVRMGAFFFGLMFGFFMIEGLEKVESENESGKNIEANIAKNVRRTGAVQIGLQVIGFALMLTNYLLIIPYLSFEADDITPYAYLILVPFFYIVGLALFILPSFWQGQGPLTRLVNRVFGYKKWVHLDRISPTLYTLGPMVIAYSTYNMQSSIYFDFTTVFTYGIGDLVIAYVLSLIVAAAFESQLTMIWTWLQYRVYGNQSKYSVLVIEQAQQGN